MLSTRDLKTGWFESWGSQLSWSPDGESIAVCSGRYLPGGTRYVITEISVRDASERTYLFPIGSISTAFSGCPIVLD